jgi:enoyl-CoA hydratase/carnithine racemase
MLMDDAGLTVTTVDGVATVVIDNGPINLFDITLYPAMARTVADLAVDESVRVVVLRSANPDFFIAHFDVSLILMLPRDAAIADELNSFHQMCETLRTMPKPTIAVIEGRVGGGGSELALSCDMRFADVDRAVFSQPEVALGILPGGSGTVRLPRLVGRSRALEVILGCDDVDARTAEAWGWVNRALSGEQLWPFVERLAARMASFPTTAIAAAKASVLRADSGVVDDLLYEGNAFNRLLGTDESHQSLRAFLRLGGQTVAGELRLGELAAEIPGLVAADPDA